MTSDARSGGAQTPPDRARARPGKGGKKKHPKRERKAMLLRLDPGLHDALARWAADDLRSTNAHVEWLLRRALKDAGRLP
ncbi:MAG: AT hook motif protein [Actinomycetales bacterium]|nr:AT hook motif protein [Actinomycetales bacterium]